MKRGITVSLISGLFFVIVGALPASAGYTQTEAINWPAANAPGQTSSDINTLTSEVENTGVKWVMLEVWWTLSETNAPTASPTGPYSAYGPTVAAWHNYNFTALDQVISNLQSHGINVVLRLDHHPSWAGGQPNCEFQPQCGIIYNSYKTTFKDNWQDFAYNLAKHYPNIQYWALWNEPNLAEEFSPQDPLVGNSIIAEYMTDIQFPGYDGVRAALPNAIMVGPELLVAAHGVNGNTCDYWGTYYPNESAHCAYWQTWTQSLLQYYQQYVTTWTFHTYDTSASYEIDAVGTIWNSYMVPLGKQRQIWLTEFNFVNFIGSGSQSGTCGLSEQSLGADVHDLYANMPNQRAFYFALFDGTGSSCGDGLVHGGPNWTPKSYLYPYFQQIVSTIP